MFGFLNVNKPKGMTSHDVIGILRKVTKIKQIGHAGTLDPFAQGVLPVSIGKATRLIEYLNDDKEYLAQITFGKSTDTYDIEGKTTFECNTKVTIQDVALDLKSFEGEILQMPPIYSAIKVDGKKLYEYARKGQEVKIEPRKVFIEKIQLQDFDEKNQIAQVLIKCSKGTYIRSIAHDLGQNLKVGAYLSQLTRTKAGNFLLKDSVVLDDLKTIQDVEKNLLEPLRVLSLPKLEINDEEHKKIMMGQSIKAPDNILLSSSHLPPNLFILVYNNGIDAVALLEGDMIKVKKVFG